MSKKAYDISSISQLESVALKLLKLSDNRIFAIYGEMGVGKTTFVKCICKHLNITDPISSPTFSIVNEYLNENNEKVFHFDLYRLESVEELEELGIETYLSSNHYCFIEWPELIQPFLIDDYTNIEIKSNNNKRELLILE
ncbi:MAG: tRNA (adenosine(37)-N6)-threonylcarbamoyltransferase complex ATPase subunit type 1 TsaE [Flavobacteriales bacterium]|nr:tRNA (adenosine(37)-N6)-threonylcarbamoyltransferase complex ATPase subunit type 1 TsaE [Flavobacteriales bacterium]|tara:strand:- start:16213 stop:16632 length:420 start_codon:yes stop_codon:yes gene_type:complete